MENKKSIRNPFPKIAKVFKYEMKHSVRILLPVYAGLVVIALLTGLLFTTLPENDSFSFSFTTNINGVEGALEQASGFLLFLYMVIVIASAVFSAIVVAKRFSNGFLGDEAYLNLTLPVTIGEHLWGRVLSAIVWICICIITMLISLLAVMIRLWKDLFGNLSQETFTTGLEFIVMVMSFALTLILFTYLINSIGHLSKKHRTFVKLLAVIVVLTVTSRFFGAFNVEYLDNHDKLSMAYIILYNSILSVIYGTATYFILKLKLNLE